jgi:excisionase family DNA binding protein
MEKQRLAYGPIDLAQKTGTSVQFIREQIRTGKLKASKLGRRVVIPVLSIEEWLESGMQTIAGSRSPRNPKGN